jgi:hypothetical protein
VQVGEALHVGLVDDGALPRDAGAALAAPGEGRVHHAAFLDEPRAVALVEGQVVARFQLVAEDLRAPDQVADDGAGIGVEEELVRVEAVAGVRRMRAVHAVAVDRARARIGQVAVPDLVGEFRQLDPVDLRLARIVEEAELHLGGVRGEEREVHARARPMSRRAEGLPLPHA